MLKPITMIRTIEYKYSTMTFDDDILHALIHDGWVTRREGLGKGYRILSCNKRVGGF